MRFMLVGVLFLIVVGCRQEISIPRAFSLERKVFDVVDTIDYFGAECEIHLAGYDARIEKSELRRWHYDSLAGMSPGVLNLSVANEKISQWSQKLVGAPSNLRYSYSEESTRGGGISYYWNEKKLLYIEVKYLKNE